jgi:hypothetical protein
MVLRRGTPTTARAPAWSEPAPGRGGKPREAPPIRGGAGERPLLPLLL